MMEFVLGYILGFLLALLVVVVVFWVSSLDEGKGLIKRINEEQKRRMRGRVEFIKPSTETEDKVRAIMNRKDIEV